MDHLHGLRKTGGPDLVATRGTDIGVVGRDLIGSGAVDVYPDHLPEQGVQVAGTGTGVVATAPVTQTQVQEAIGAEADEAAVVIAERLHHGEHGSRRRGGLEIGRDVEFHQHRGVVSPTARRGVPGEHPTVRRVVGMYRDRQQPSLPTHKDIVRYVEEWLGPQCPVLEDSYQAVELQRSGSGSLRAE